MTSVTSKNSRECLRATTPSPVFCRVYYRLFFRWERRIGWGGAGGSLGRGVGAGGRGGKGWVGDRAY